MAGMRHILLMIAVVALVGCGKKTTPAEPEINAEPKVAAKKLIPPKAFTNTLGVPHPTNATTAIIKRICFMPATLRLTGSGVNAVGGEKRRKG